MANRGLSSHLREADNPKLKVGHLGRVFLPHRMGGGKKQRESPLQALLSRLEIHPPSLFTSSESQHQLTPLHLNMGWGGGDKPSNPICRGADI